MFLCYGIVVATAGDQQNPQCHNTRFVQIVSRLTTVHEVDKAYGVLTLIVFNIVPFCSYTISPNVAATVGNTLQTPLSRCLTASSLNFV